MTPLSVDLDQVERNEVSTQELTLDEWKVVRSRVRLLEIRLAAHLLDSEIYGGS
jgi:hypothetical protein